MIFQNKKFQEEEMKIFQVRDQDRLYKKISINIIIGFLGYE